MIFPTFDTAKHNSYGARYAIDWTTHAEQKYKEIIAGVRVYENGRIVINKNGHGDPLWRNTVSGKLGLTFKLKTEFVHCSFYDPTTQKRVNKSDILDDMLLHYKDRAYAVASWRSDEAIQFLHADAQPRPGGSISYSTRNTRREKEARSKLQECIALGTTLNAVNPLKSKWGETYVPSIDERALTCMLFGTAPYPTDTTAESVQKFARSLAPVGRLDTTLQRLCRDKFEAEYLVVRYK